MLGWRRWRSGRSVVCHKMSRRSKSWRAGTYELVALAILEDLAGNQIGQPFEVDIFERIDSPDDIAETHRITFVIRD